MDWNNDGKIAGWDYAHYKSVIDTGSNSSSSNSSGRSSYSATPTAAKWIICLIIVYVILKFIGLDWYGFF